MTNETKQQIEMALDFLDIVRKQGFNPVYWASDTSEKLYKLMSNVDPEEVRRELSLAKPPTTYRLKVAVNRRGRLIVLEEFPQDEHHAGLHEMIPDLEDGEYDIESGIYHADCVVETSMHYNAPSPDDSTHLNIIRFTKV